MKTLDDEWYVVIKAYKLTVFEILRNFFVLSYIARPRYPYIRVYRLYDDLFHTVKYPMLCYMNLVNGNIIIEQGVSMYVCE